MLNENSLHAVEAARWGECFVRPLYGSYCFSGLPGLIRQVLTQENGSGLPEDVLGSMGREFDTVILIFLDAHGWNLVPEALERFPLARRLAEQGVLSKLTAQFPSTTAAHVTTIHTGLPTGQSGIYAWTYFEPRLGTAISPLPFAFAGERRGSLRHTGLSAADLLPTHTLHQELAGQGVQSFVLGGAEMHDSPYSEVMHAGAEVLGNKTFCDAVVNLGELLARPGGKRYFYLYFDKIDSLSHVHGPLSPQVAAECETAWFVLERFFHQNIGPRLQNTLLLITADHGQVTLDPAKNLWLNREFPELVPALETDRLGRPLTMIGSRRDRFLHIRPQFLDVVQQQLREGLRGRAEVYRTEELIAWHFFDREPPSQAFLERVGNLVVLPYAGWSVLWEDGIPEGCNRGHHGGLTPDEMEIPLFALAY